MTDLADFRRQLTRYDRGDIVLFLEDQLSIQCYDKETAAELRTAVVENVKDGTTTEDDVISFLDGLGETREAARAKLTDHERRVLGVG